MLDETLTGVQRDASAADIELPSLDVMMVPVNGPALVSCELVVS